MESRSLIVYTTEEGGYFKVILGTREQYDEAVATGVLRVPQGLWVNGELQYKDEHLVYIVFAPETENYDFVLRGNRYEPSPV